jgi:hypothetical protein
MLQVLDNTLDIEHLAAEEGYSQKIGRSYLQTRRATLERYLVELEADFDELARVSEERALYSPDLAELLLTTRDALNRCKRYVRIRILIDQVLPTPRGGGRLGVLRRFVLKLLPRASVSYEVLAKMNSLHAILRP